MGMIFDTCIGIRKSDIKKCKKIEQLISEIDYEKKQNNHEYSFFHTDKAWIVRYYNDEYIPLFDDLIIMLNQEKIEYQAITRCEGDYERIFDTPDISLINVFSLYECYECGWNHEYENEEKNGINWVDKEHRIGICPGCNREVRFYKNQYL